MGMDEAAAEYRRVNLSSDPLYGYIQVTKSGGVPGLVAEQDLIDRGVGRTSVSDSGSSPSQFALCGAGRGDSAPGWAPA
jgi:hypothetical protein